MMSHVMSQWSEECHSKMSQQNVTVDVTGHEKNVTEDVTGHVTEGMKMSQLITLCTGFAT